MAFDFPNAESDNKTLINDAPKMKPLPPLERIKELLAYDPESGIFTWRQAVSRRVRVGSVAGTVTKSLYLRIAIDGSHYAAHRLAWLYHHGDEPPLQIDHVNRDRADNRIQNLRVLSNTENSQNVGMKRNNTSGYAGVVWHKQRSKWAAQIMVNRKNHYLGLYDTPEEANAARVAAKAALHPLSL